MGFVMLPVDPKWPSKMWWVGHVFLGLITGIICYVVWKEDNKKAAKKHLVWSLIIMLAVWGGYFAALFAGIVACGSVIEDAEIGTEGWLLCSGLLSNLDVYNLLDCTDDVYYSMSLEEQRDYYDYLDEKFEGQSVDEIDLVEYAKHALEYPAMSECRGLPL